MVENVTLMVQHLSWSDGLGSLGELEVKMKL
jgi:hypothetical protein